MKFEDVKTALAFAWGKCKANPGFYFGGFLVLALVFGVAFVAVDVPVCFVLALAKTPLSLINVVSFVITAAVQVLLLGPLLLGYYKGIKKDFEGTKASAGDVFSGFSSYVHAAGTMFFLTVLSSVFTIPTFVLNACGFKLVGLLFSLCPLVLIPISVCAFISLANGEARRFGLDAFLAGVKEWNVLLAVWTLLLTFCAFLGVVFCVIGLFVTSPFFMLAVWRLCSAQMGMHEPVSSPEQTV